MSYPIRTIDSRRACRVRRVPALVGTFSATAVLLLLLLASLPRTAAAGEADARMAMYSASASDHSALAPPIPPEIVNPRIDESSDYLHAVETDLYYGNGMSLPQTFYLRGEGTGDNLDVLFCDDAFGEGPFWDYTPDLWECGPYNVSNSDSGDGTITVYLVAGAHSDQQIFTYTRDIVDPSSAATSPEATATAPIPVGFSAHDGTSGVRETCLWYRPEDGDWLSTTPCLTGTVGTFPFDPPGGANGTYYFQTVAQDNVSNVEAGPSGDGDTHTIYDTVAPSSTASAPDFANTAPIQVDWSAEDQRSGPKETCLWYNLGGDGWISTTLCSSFSGGTFDFAPPSDVNGIYYFQTIAADRAGNVEAGPSDRGDDATIFDTVVPSITVVAPSVSGQLSWPVNWLGVDPEPASGIDRYDVFYQVDAGTWLTWHQGITATSATFGPISPVPVQKDHTYGFRARAYDRAGNLADSPVAATRVVEIRVFLPLMLRDYRYVPLTNAGFEEGWTGWTHGGDLAQEINDANVHSGSFAALLGNPAYNCRGGVPLGSAWIEQRFSVPTGADTLRIYYRIFSQDKFAGDQYDRFQILVNGAVVLMDGNQTDVYDCDHPAQSADWQLYDLDLTPYAGQIITLRLENWSDYDSFYNTWTYVDDIQLLP